MISLLLSESGSSSKWVNIFADLLKGRLPVEKIRALLLLLAKKGEEGSEIRGCLKAILKAEPPAMISLPFLIDVCGTGGDGKRTFNISTVSGFVIAGAGAYVAKHGNRSVSSLVGSSDLMEALGIELDLPLKGMLLALRKFHFAYFHAPYFHPSFKPVQAVRRELGIRTLFNTLGPLVNPVHLHYQMIGISNSEWTDPVLEALKLLDRRKAAIVHSDDGLDELSTSTPSDILYLEGKKAKKLRLDPLKLGFKKPSRGSYEGGDLKTNRKIALGILEGKLRGPEQDIVLLNSGFALWLTGLSSTVQEGVERSRWAIRTGRAMGVLLGLRQFTRNQRNRI